MRKRGLMGILVVAIMQALSGQAEAVVSRSLTPVESLAAWVARYRAGIDAIRAGDCATFKRLNVRRTLALTCNPETRQQLANFRVLGWQQFGTGAIVDVIDVSQQTQRPGGFTTILALGPGRRFYSFGTSGFGATTGGGFAQIGTPTAPRTASIAARTARLALLSLRTRNCNLFYTTWFTGKLTKGPACAQVFGPRPAASRIRRLRLQLAADPTATPVRIGGTRDIVFFRLRLRSGHYWTLEIDRSGLTSGPLAGGHYITSARDVY
jgi:hypothetical protein